MAAHKPFDYSKWDNIEISDDEEDCHPNIDKASWFRMKHRSRVEREDVENQEKQQMLAENARDAKRCTEITSALERNESESLRVEFEELQRSMRERAEKIRYAEENRKWNVDNICHVADEKTIISKSKSQDPEELKEGSMMRTGANSQKTIGPESEKEAVLSYAKFVELHEQELEDFLAVVDWGDAQKMLHENGSVLLHEHSQSYALLSCLEDEMNGYHAKMVRAAKNSQILSHISELATSMNRHPRDVVLPFFDRIQKNPAFVEGFDDSVDAFAKRIAQRAIDKRQEMAAEEKELTAEERIGPGGLDPVQVFENLPPSLQEAFEKKDMGMLQVALEALPIEDAKKHMADCEASGLWVPKKSSSGGGDDEKDDENDDDDDDEEEDDTVDDD